MLTTTWRWTLDREAAPLRTAAVDHSNSAAYLALTRERKARVKRRSATLAATVMVLVALAAVLALAAPGWFRAVVLLHRRRPWLTVEQLAALIAKH